MGDQIDWERLIAEAWRARSRAYAPYSAFCVGAALLTESGEIFGGCNVENGSFGLTICAERSAVAAAVLAGHRRFAGLAITAEADIPIAPCGACRQVLAEFHPSLPIRSAIRDGVAKEWKLFSLLPEPFVMVPSQ